MRALGNKICYHSPSRGFCMDLSAMFTVLMLSKLGVPVSTTHCKSGATSAVGLASSGSFAAVNWRMLAVILFGWIVTVPAAGVGVRGSEFSGSSLGSRV
jgi:sodium-dependent phosphate transporter